MVHSARAHLVVSFAHKHISRWFTRMFGIVIPKTTALDPGNGNKCLPVSNYEIISLPFSILLVYQKHSLSNSSSFHVVMGWPQGESQSECLFPEDLRSRERTHLVFGAHFGAERGHKTMGNSMSDCIKQ